MFSSLFFEQCVGIDKNHDVVWVIIGYMDHMVVIVCRRRELTAMVNNTLSAETFGDWFKVL